MDRAVRQLVQHRWRVLIALFVVLGIAASLGLRFYLRPTVESGSVGQLARLVGQHRLARARLAGGFYYAPCTADSSTKQLLHGLSCGVPQAASWPTSKRLAAFANDTRVDGEHGSPSTQARTSGIFNLVWGRVDDAVADLRSAVRLDASNARALNDLAVALTDFAEQHDDPSALVEAFVAADSAVRKDSMLTEARFTHALILERLYLRTDAIGAWKRYLELDRKSPWAREAQEHLAALQPRGDTTKRRDRLRRAAAAHDSLRLRSIVDESPSGARLTIEDELGEWGATLVGGESGRAREHLEFARAIAGPLGSVTGDSLFIDAIKVIDGALVAKDTERTRALAEGHASLAKAIDDFNRPKTNVANVDFTRPWRLLASGGSPMTGWALLYAARAKINAQRDTALGLLSKLRDSTPEHYFALRSATAQYQGFVYDVSSDYMHVRAAYDSAVSENRTTREPAITLRLASWLASMEGVLRGRDAGWRIQYAALAATPQYPTSSTSYYTVFDYAAGATAREAPRLAVRYCDASIRVARQMADTARLTYALRRRAELWADLGQMDSARTDIATAREIVNRLDQTGPRNLIADVMLADAHLALRSRPAEAEAKLRKVVNEYRIAKYDKGLPSAYLNLAQARAATQAIDSARAAFDSATRVLQRQRATIAAYAERGAFLDDARSVIEQIVTFHAAHNARDAFEYFEGTRSRVLLEQRADNRGQSVDQRPVLAELQQRLKKDDVVLSYAVLPQELLVWSITRNGFEQHHIPVTAPDLEGLINRFQQSLLASDQPDSATSDRLYKLLVDSASRLQPGANLFVVPDRWLHFVPFVALRNPSSGRYLVLDHAVSYAPSATLLLASLAQPPQHFSQRSKVLAIGNPAFDRQALQLPNLPAAESEAHRVASLYADQNLLTGRDATDKALERLAPDVDILHFAGHAIVGRDAPQLSHLVLASDGHSTGVVFSPDIAQWKLRRTGLVILSGCNTADGKLSATEGAASLARAFFAAGVPTVVSSLWAIEDEDTADFFAAFHRWLVQGYPPAVALRETQIKWLDDGRVRMRPVRSWAAFQLFGG
jgi:CHAT domain-containing protein